MPKRKIVEPIRAAQGERMIEIKIHLWTNNLTEGKGMIRPKHAWAGGMVRLEKNKSHNISPKKPVPFHTLMDLPVVVEKVLIANGITLHVSRKMKKYFEVDE